MNKIIVSIETAKGGPLTLDWAQGLAVGWTGLDCNPINCECPHWQHVQWKTVISFIPFDPTWFHQFDHYLCPNPSNRHSAISYQMAFRWNSWLERKFCASWRRRVWRPTFPRISTTWSRRPSPSGSISRGTERIAMPNSVLFWRNPGFTASLVTSRRSEFFLPPGNTSLRLPPPSSPKKLHFREQKTHFINVPSWALMIGFHINIRILNLAMSLPFLLSRN